MIFLKYKEPKAEYVQFQRLALGIMTLAAVLFERIDFIYAFLALSIITLVTTVCYSPTTLIFKLCGLLLRRPLFFTPARYAHSYVTNRLAETFEDILRICGGVIIIYLYSISPLAAWMMASFMSIAMLVSGFFGFCLSSLVYIGYQCLNKKCWIDK